MSRTCCHGVNISGTWSTLSRLEGSVLPAVEISGLSLGVCTEGWLPRMFVCAKVTSCLNWLQCLVLSTCTANQRWNLWVLGVTTIYEVKTDESQVITLIKSWNSFVQGKPRTGSITHSRLKSFIDFSPPFIKKKNC